MVLRATSQGEVGITPLFNVHIYYMQDVVFFWHGEGSEIDRSTCRLKWNNPESSQFVSFYAMYALGHSSYI